MNNSEQQAVDNKPKAIDLIEKNLAKRYRAEKRFRFYGIASITFGLLCLLVLFSDIIGKGYTAFFQTEMKLTINLDSERLGINDPSDSNQVAMANYDSVIRAALLERFDDVSGRRNKRDLYSLVSSGAGYQLRQLLETKPQLLDTTFDVWLLADDDVDTYFKSLSSEVFSGRMNDKKIAWLDNYIANDTIEQKFNVGFFTSGDSREPEQAGIRGAIMGSLFSLMVTIVLALPIGVAAAIYLEEYAPNNKFTEFIEVNINNLAAVPSIIFGLLGLAIFISFFGMPRSVPLVGGLVLTLMTLPTIIISSRAAIKAVPPSIREAAMGMGASKMQVILHHVLPLAMPGMLTGAIIGLAQALGETAPLLMIGMIAFIVDIPGSVMDPATALPVQIFLWADSPERAFVERTSAAIMVLLGFLICMNTLAVILRKKLERRW